MKNKIEQGRKVINKMGDYRFQDQPTGHILNVNPLEIPVAVVNRHRGITDDGAAPLVIHHRIRNI